MKVREEKLRTIIEWSEKNEDVRVLLLTSSLVNPLALVDEFSDLDIEFVFEDNTNYISDKSWTLKFGNPIAMIEEDESCFNHKHAMKMLLYEDGVKVDFKLYSKSKFIKETQEKELPEDWDIGYKILIDKDGITKQMLKPTYQISIIKKPSEKEFQNLINDFWWDTTYVAKCLVRDEIFYAKFMSETVIRTEYLIPLIEWHIASEHNWNITTNKYGRLFKKYLNQEMWAKTEQTFSGSDIKENWTALFSIEETTLVKSHRCPRCICDFASLIMPQYPEMKSVKENSQQEHCLLIKNCDVGNYVDRFNPVALIWNNKALKNIHPNIKQRYNMGEVKGLDFPNVIVYPTENMLTWINNTTKQLADETRAKLYVAVTRAEITIGIIVPDDFCLPSESILQFWSNPD